MAARTLKLWQALFVGPILIALGIWEYRRLAEFEDEGGVIFLDRFTAFLYRIGGKNTVLVLTCAAGVFYIALLWRWFQLTRAADRLEAAAEPADAPAAKRPRARPNGERPAPRPPATPAETDPYRSPPTTPLQVIRPVAPAAPTPIEKPADGDADGGPSILR